MARFTYPADHAGRLPDQAARTARTATTRRQRAGRRQQRGQGSDTSGDFCGESNNDGQTQQYTVYFDITFDQPFTASQIDHRVRTDRPGRGATLTFDTTQQPGRRRPRSASPT